MEKKAPTVDPLSTNSILYGILFEIEERNELLTQIGRELALANDLRGLELRERARINSFEKCNREIYIDLLEQSTGCFKAWRRT